jgi:carboxymethylenebutenolidase
MPAVDFGTPNGSRAAHLSLPRGEGPWPGVVLIHEVFGLNDDIRALGERFASMGYVALAPDFYAGGKWRKCMRAAFRELEAGRGPFFDTIESARCWVAAHDGCSGKVGVIGFCLGGGFALLAAPRYDFAAASVNYGEVPEDAERILSGACPVVASYGGRDRTMRGHPERLEAALAANHVEHDVKVYPQAGHSFLGTRPYPGGLRVLARVMGMHAGPHAESARDAWDRIDSFFSAHLR